MPPVGHVCPMPRYAPWATACSSSLVLIPIFVFRWLHSAFSVCIYVFFNQSLTCTEAGWRLNMLSSHYQPHLPGLVLESHVFHTWLGFCSRSDRPAEPIILLPFHLHSKSCRGMFIQNIGSLHPPNVCHSWKAVAIHWCLTNFLLFHGPQMLIFLFKAFPKANHLLLKQEKIYYI